MHPADFIRFLSVDAFLPPSSVWRKSDNEQQQQTHASCAGDRAQTSKMTAGLPFPQEATPYAWDDTRAPPPETVRLWTEVGNGIDKSQTGTLLGLSTFRSHFRNPLVR